MKVPHGLFDGMSVRRLCILIRLCVTNCILDAMMEGGTEDKYDRDQYEMVPMEDLSKLSEETLRCLLTYLIGASSYSQEIIIALQNSKAREEAIVKIRGE